MFDLLIKDLEKEMAEAETEERNYQADFETMMRESAAKRSSESKLLSVKMSTLADTEGVLLSLEVPKSIRERVHCPLQVHRYAEQQRPQRRSSMTLSGRFPKWTRRPRHGSASTRRLRMFNALDANGSRIGRQ